MPKVVPFRRWSISKWFVCSLFVSIVGSLALLYFTQSADLRFLRAPSVHNFKTPQSGDDRWMFRYLDTLQQAALVERQAHQWQQEELHASTLLGIQHVNTICETAFNGGHSSLRWLLHSAAHVYSFDFNEHTYTGPAATWIAQLYPGRFDIIAGDAAATLPKFKQDHTCDLIFVNGGDQSYAAAARSLQLFEEVATPGSNTVMMADVYCDFSWCQGPTSAWKESLASGTIIESGKKTSLYGRHGFVYGSYQESNPGEDMLKLLNSRARNVKQKSFDIPSGIEPVSAFGCFLINRPDLAIQMLDSIDHPVNTLVMVHMADSNPATNRAVDVLFQWLDAGKFPWKHNYVKRVITLHNGVNLGFGAGVNQIIHADPSAPYWLIVSNDVWFKNGSLAEVAHKMSRLESHRNACVWGLCGDPISQYASFVITRRAVSTAGYFDENFWPAYGEDCDYTARLLRGHCPLIYEADPSRLANHVGSAAWKTTDKISTLAKIVQEPGPAFNNWDYLGMKWGDNICDARHDTKPYMRMVGFRTPFDDPSLTVKSWSLDRGRRAMKGGPDQCVQCSGEGV